LSKTHGDQKFDSDIGAKATVEHHAIENNPDVEALRAVLSDIGTDLQRIGAAPKGMKYMGSFSVHVYSAEGLKGNYAFASLCHTGDTFFKLAEAAGMKLSGDIQNMYRGSMQKLRSGFASGGGNP